MREKWKSRAYIIKGRKMVYYSLLKFFNFQEEKMAIWVLMLGLVCLILGFGLFLYGFIFNKSWAYKLAFGLLFVDFVIQILVELSFLDGLP